VSGCRHFRGGLSKPRFETRFAKPGVVAGDQRALLDFRTRVSGVRVSDDLARIIERCQSPPYKFIDAKRFGAPNFDSAVDGLSDSDPAHSSCDIIGGHRLEKCIRQTHLRAVEGNVGKLLQEFEKLCRLDDRLGDRSTFDQLLLNDLGSEVAAFGQPFGSNDRECDVMSHACGRFMSEEVTG